MHFTKNLAIYLLAILPTTALPTSVFQMRKDHNDAIASPDIKEDRTQYFHHPWPNAKDYLNMYPGALITKFSSDFQSLSLKAEDYTGADPKYEKLVMSSDTNSMTYEERPAACRFADVKTEGTDEEPVMVVEIQGFFRLELKDCRARQDYFDGKDNWSRNWLAKGKNRKPIWRKGEVLLGWR